MIIINGAPNVGDDLTAISLQIATVDAKVELVDNFVDTEIAAIKTETDKIAATIVKIDAIKTKTDAL